MSSDECGLCLDDSVFGYCNDCPINLCQKCFFNHEQVVIFSGHILCPLNASNQATHLTEQIGNDIHEEDCFIHPTHKQSFYCVKDDETICGRCICSNHSKCIHDIVDLNDVSFDENLTNELMIPFEQLVEEISTLDETISGNLQLNDECKTTCITEITEYSKKLEDILADRREKAIREVLLKHEQNENIIRKAESKCKEAKQHINTTCDLITDLSEKKHERHLFVVSKRLGTEIDAIETVIQQSTVENSFFSKFSFLKNAAVEHTL
ncbi:hypothetical protein DPMN_137374 [Dreissena polymorpha]|uniref:B box-type domain-containing protein n=1 Tax=Dreissena polymorpha TaxID=45954 RepID=A0A9D4G2G7_DREPO|nr:hypothetical protein DPMN_137374 [Dreissena polymorpha]